MASSQVANQRRWDSHATHVRTNDRCSSLTSALRKWAAARYQTCAVDWWVLSLCMHRPPHQPQGPAVRQAGGQSFLYILNPTPYFLDFCKLCFLSVLLGGHESVVGPVIPGVT